MMAIECAALCYWSSLLIKSDSTYSLNLLSSHSETVPWCWLSRWLNCLHLLSSMQFQVLLHTFREGNQVAYCLASTASMDFFWWNCCPDFLFSFVSIDFFGPGYYRFS
ncbi:Ribonuclease H-like domain containing protein [Parasponia andersonii]|uniref:Ribonuclease H-like domain containing protein n=1 Tax=Parasponia andersonii TaxID=3476 RepID=A0A2P5DUE6_PARAD|nr:Ribonuclease H-like domain containing protein [Parasponia andersonii]